MNNRTRIINNRTRIILEILAQGDRRGREINDLLKSRGIRLWAPAFYLHMARYLVDTGLVRQWDETKMIDGLPFPLRCFGITEKGRSLLESQATVDEQSAQRLT